MRKNSKHFREAVGDISLEGGFILVTKQLVIFWGSTSTLSIYQQQKHSSFRHSECHSSRIISLIWQIPNQYHHVNTKTIVKSQFVRTHFWNSKVLNHFWKKIKWSASSRWSFGPKSEWDSIETATIGHTHPLYWSNLNIKICLLN